MPGFFLLKKDMSSPTRGSRQRPQQNPGAAAAPVAQFDRMKPLTLPRFLARITVVGAPPFRIIRIPIGFTFVAKLGSTCARIATKRCIVFRCPLEDQARGR